MDCKDALTAFGISSSDVTQIYRSAWNIDDCYILKKNKSRLEFDKSMMFARLLSSKGVPVVEFISTADGNPYFFTNGEYYCLMKKISGKHIDPFSGDCRRNGIMLGQIVATLHQALAEITVEEGIYNADFASELESWIMPELNEKQLAARFDDGVIPACREITQTCKSLPRQIIHRDMHPGNLLFDDGKFSGYLDFDISQRNIRVFDICYLGCSLLVENYSDSYRLRQWQEIFNGIVSGYETIQALTDAEKDALPDLFIFDEVLFAAYFSKQNLPELADRCVDMTNWLYRHIKALVGKERNESIYG